MIEGQASAQAIRSIIPWLLQPKSAIYRRASAGPSARHSIFIARNDLEKRALQLKALVMHCCLQTETPACGRRPIRVDLPVHPDRQS